jgi:hypothetical protein
MSLSLLPVSLRSEPLRDLIDASNDPPALTTAATHFRDQEATSNLRFRFVLAESESGSTPTRPAWATERKPPLGAADFRFDRIVSS